MSAANDASPQQGATNSGTPLGRSFVAALYAAVLLGLYLLVPGANYRTLGWVRLKVTKPEVVASVFALYDNPAFTNHAAGLLREQEAQISREAFFSADWLRKHVSLEVIQGDVLQVAAYAPTYEESREVGGAMLQSCVFLQPNPKAAQLPQAVLPVGQVGPMEMPSDPQLTEIRRKIFQVIEANVSSNLPGLPIPDFANLHYAEDLRWWRIPLLVVGTLIWAFVGWRLCYLLNRHNQPALLLS